MFNCLYCNYNTNNRKDYNKHLLTNKHKQRSEQQHPCVDVVKMEDELPNMDAFGGGVGSHAGYTTYKCSCGKLYHDRTGLWRHRKKCSACVEDGDFCGNESGATKQPLSPEIISDMLKIIKEQHELLKELIPKVGNTNNVTNNNTNNTQFNLNVFLNEECKDAVNMTDFINSLEITLDDLAVTKSQGLVEGICKVLINGLKQMDIYKRPIHCTDQKRDTIYIKDNHKWHRDEGNVRIRKVFVDIANKEYKAIKMWMDCNPGWETNTRLQDVHHKMVKNVLHEIQDDPVGERKILKCLEREIFVEK